MTGSTLRFIKNGRPVSLTNVPADRMLLQVLREDLNLSGTKEGCNEGDCGACTVVTAELDGDGLRFRAVNSCIRFAHSVAGLAVWTVEDLSASDGSLHPVQQAMVDQHGTQCGFCTPGFVMSLFGMYQSHTAEGKAIDRETAVVELAGNLCRCTGYRPILDAAQSLGAYPPAEIDRQALADQLKALASETAGATPDGPYLRPENLHDLMKARSRYPQAQLIAGSTDVGLWVNKLHQTPQAVIDITRVAECRTWSETDRHDEIGSAVRLADVFPRLAQKRPILKTFFNRFAGLPIRQSATLGGNIANGSPIGDTMPLLMALRAAVTVAGPAAHRVVAIDQFYTGYRKNVLAADEVILSIQIPKPGPSEFLRVYKISKRFDDDISCICLALCAQIVDGRMNQVSIGVGGAAATPARASKTEAALEGQLLTAAVIDQAAQVIGEEFSPISDMRASARYRRQLLANLLKCYLLDYEQGGLVRLDEVSAL
jgi:xanthine dehydrogenase small subunit